MKSSPYEPKFMSSKIPPKTVKQPLNNSSKKEEEKGPVMAFERPQSASNTEKKKATAVLRGLAPSLAKGTVFDNSDEFMTNSTVKRATMGRYPSPMVMPKDSDNLAVSSTQYRDKWRGL